VGCARAASSFCSARYASRRTCSIPLTGVEPVKVAILGSSAAATRSPVEGDVRNTGDDTGPLQVEVRYFDRDGHSIGKDVVSMDGLRRGAATHFKSSPRPDNGVRGFFRYI